MGTVYEARRASDQQRAALKVLSLGQGADWKGRELFARSAQVLQGLQHPALPEVYAYEERDDGLLCLVREALDGGTLHERVKQGARLSPEQFETLAVELLTLLDYLHGLVPPVFHRDIKPQNLMFRARDSWAPVLVDFDTVAAPGRPQGGLTIVGTPGYTAPEQFSGIVSPASDLYSLGMTLLYVATHADPDDLPRDESGRLVLGERLHNLPPRVRRVLVGLTEPERSQRYATATEALRELRAKSPEPSPRPVGVPPSQAEREAQNDPLFTGESPAQSRATAQASARRDDPRPSREERRQLRRDAENGTRPRSASVSSGFAARIAAHNRAQVSLAQEHAPPSPPPYEESERPAALARPSAWQSWGWLLSGLALMVLSYLVFFRRLGARGVTIAVLVGVVCAFLTLAAQRAKRR
jgi:serine/threonine protein kinase